MALPILDGNQTAATLSTIVTGGQHIPAHTVVSLGSQAITDMRSAVSGSVVSISNFPSTQTIAGTVTANLSAIYAGEATFSQSDNPMMAVGGLLDGFNEIRPIKIDNNTGGQIVAGTVTANLSKGDTGGNPLFSYIVDPNNDLAFASDYPFPISGTVTVGNSVTIGSLPSGALTTRFGSVTTANTAQITSAVTNTSRKYLLAQNISAGTVTIGIGFSPTTTQGVQLPAGGGLTFDAFCPTGAVYWLGAVTGAALTILEG